MEPITRKEFESTAVTLTKFVTDVHPLTGKTWTLSEFVNMYVIPMQRYGMCACTLCKGEDSENNNNRKETDQDVA